MENRCCKQCLGEKLFALLARQIEPSSQGSCSYCQSANQELLPVEKLSDYFEWSREIYKRTCNPEGKCLLYWLREDWGIFDTLDDSIANRLLSDIFTLDDLNLSDLRIPENLEGTKKSDAWQRFKLEIQHQNRWISTSSKEASELREDFMNNLAELEEDKISNHYYRARIHNTKKLFTPQDLNAPPQEVAGHGRLNPAGIPYLYLASLEKTAIAEVRPHPGQNVVTAKFQVKSPESPGLKIANLIKFTPQVSPIEILDTDEILRIRTLYVALKEISLDFSRPVRPDATPYEYIPTQYLCEIIKGEGFDGVAYPSAISDGHNIVLFDPPSFSALEDSLTEYRIKSVFVDIEEFKST